MRIVNIFVLFYCLFFELKELFCYLEVNLFMFFLLCWFLGWIFCFIIKVFGYEFMGDDRSDWGRRLIEVCRRVVL